MSIPAMLALWAFLLAAFLLAVMLRSILRRDMSSAVFVGAGALAFAAGGALLLSLPPA